MNNNENDLNRGAHDDQAAQKLNNLAGQNRNNNYGRNPNRFRQNPFSRPASGLQKNNKLGKSRDNNLANNHQRPNLGMPTNDAKSQANDANTTNPNALPNKKNDIGSRNLQNSLANRAKNAFRNKKKKKNKDSSDASNNSTDNNEESSGNNSEKSAKEEAAIIRKRIKMIKLISIGLALFAFVFTVLLIAEILTGGNALKSAPAASSQSYGTDEFESLTDEDNKYHDDEIKYYEKLKELDDGTININYVNALVLTLYYEDAFEITNEELRELTGGLDFAEMTKMAEKFAKIIKDIGSDDYAINGTIFNELKDNSIVQNYYKDVVENTSYEEILTRAFEMGEYFDAHEIVDDTVMSDETMVTVFEMIKDTGDKTETKSKRLSVSEYIVDSIYATSSSVKNSELVKAYTIAYSTNLVAENKNLSVNENNVNGSNTLCDVKLGCSYDERGNLVSGGGLQSSKNTFYYNGDYYYKLPLNETDITNLNNSVNSVFGNVLVNTDGTYPTLDIDKLNGLGDGYKAILTSSYGDLKFKNIGEDSYILDGSYGTKQVKTAVKFYDQNNYGSYNFCGKKNETIKTSGCGPTSMAIIVSTYENNSKYDPVYMMGEARKTGYCGGGITGTSPGFFKKEANIMKYKYYQASKRSTKDLNLVLQHLSQGDLVIAHMGSGHFTSGGHYIVLGGVDPESKKVYVYDPYDKVNRSYRKTGNGWYSFNDIIVKEAFNFYIVWKG